MKNRSVVAYLSVVSLLALPLLAQTTTTPTQYLLPQVGNGTFSGGSIRTTFILFNPTDGAVNATIKLRDDAGNPMAVSIPSLGTTDQFGPITLQKGETKILQTDGSGALSVGSATIGTDGTLGVSAVFSLFDTHNNFLTEGGVGSADTMTDFVIPVDASASFNTGLALVNPGQSDANITYQLADLTGKVVSTNTATLGAGRHVAQFVTGQGGLFASQTNFQGTLHVTSSQNVAAVTIRQKATPISYTTLPVVSTASTATTFNLPQVANGTQGNLTMKTTFVVFNLAQSAATVNVTVRKSDGTAFPLTLPGVAGSSSGSFSQSVPGGGSVFLETDGSGPLSVGAAQVSSSVPIGVSAIFTLSNAGNFQTEAGVGDSPTRTDFTLPVDQSGNFSTGVAFFNPGDAAVTVNVRMLDAAGNRLAESTPLQLPSKNQVAKFVSELFPGQTTTNGSLAVSSSGPVAAVTLRESATPIVFTTLPVVTGTSNGTLPPGAGLMSEVKANIDASSNATVSTQLKAGFKITGVFSGKIEHAQHISATDSSGTQFIGSIDHATGEYQIVVPPGSYKLSLCYKPRMIGMTNRPFLEFNESNPTTVNTDITHDFAVPDVTLQRIHGSLTGVAQLPANGGVTLAFHDPTTDTTLITPVAADGTYDGGLPSGTYTVSLLVTGVGTPAQQEFAVYAINTQPVQVGTGVVGASFVLPAMSTIHGKIRMADNSAAPANTLLGAVDQQAANPNPDPCSNEPLVENLVMPDASGNFQMMLANGKSYELGLTTPFSGGGTISFLPGRMINNLTAGLVEDFSLPAFPAAVTISGQVTNPDGQGLKGVTVSAQNSQLGNAGLGFSNSAVTDDSGNYTMTVLGGTGYKLTFTPPAQ